MTHGPSGCKSYRAYCPYYMENYTDKIVCEGIVPGSKIILEFDDQKDRKQQMKIFCNSSYCNRCEIYTAITNAKYLCDIEEMKHAELSE